MEAQNNNSKCCFAVCISVVMLCVFGAIAMRIGRGLNELLNRKTAFVQIERKPNTSSGSFFWFASRGAQSVDVMVNNTKIGSLANGRRDTFAFDFRSSQNTIQIVNNGDISEVLNFEATPNSSTNFVCRYLEEKNNKGYDIALRLADETENQPVVAVNPIKIIDVIYDKQLQSDVIERYPPVTVRKGVQQTFWHKMEVSKGITVIDTAINRSSIGIDVGATAFLGPLMLKLKSLGGSHSNETEQQIIKESKQKITETQSLTITGDGVPKTLYWRINYKVGIAKARVGDKTVDIRFKEPRDVFLLSE